MALPSDADWSVYYAREESTGAIKIGSSREVRQRLLTIAREYRRHFTLLATEPGDRRVEYQRHDQFAAARLRDSPELGDTSELFEPTDELMGHIETLEPASGEEFGREWESITIRVCPSVAARLRAKFSGTRGRSLHVVAEHALTAYLRRDDSYTVRRTAELEAEVELLRGRLGLSEEAAGEVHRSAVGLANQRSLMRAGPSDPNGW